MTIIAYDSINVNSLPAGGGAYFGYVGGNWPTYNTVKQRFPTVTVGSIAVNASEDAMILDVENGDAVASDVPAWVARQKSKGATKPCIYTSVSNVSNVLKYINRSEIRIWTAHYTHEHICSPSCYVGMPTIADGTQWFSNNNYDQSILNDNFFSLTPIPPAPPKPLPPIPIPGENMHIIRQNVATDVNGDGWTDISLGSSTVCGGPWVLTAQPGKVGDFDKYDHAHAELCIGAASGHQRVSVVNAQPNAPEYTVFLPVTP